MDVNNFSIIPLNELNNIQRKIKKNRRIIIDLSSTKYELFRNVATIFDW